MTDIKIGSKVSYKSFGLVSKIEGNRGKIVTGTVTDIDLNLNTVCVLPDHRTLPSSAYKNVQTCVEISNCKSI